MLKKIISKQTVTLMTVLVGIASLCKQPLHAGSECCGKAELAAAYVHVDVLESGKTVHRMDMAGVKADFNWRFYSAFILKPQFLYSHGSGKNELITAGVGIGFCYPVCEGINFTPIAGVNWGWLKTTLEIENPFNPLADIKLTEKFRSLSPYVAIEGSYTFCPGWRIVGNVQYSWSRTHTTIEPFIKDTSHSEGFSYSGMIEYDFCQNWSINLGGAYNISLTKEKHGLRAWGGKLGIAYWF